MAAVQLADQRSVLAVLAAADSAKQSVAEQLQQAAEKLAFHSAEQLLAAVQLAEQLLLLPERLPAVQSAVQSLLLPELLPAVQSAGQSAGQLLLLPKLPPAVQSAGQSLLLPEFLPAM